MEEDVSGKTQGLRSFAANSEAQDDRVRLLGGRSANKERSR